MNYNDFILATASLQFSLCVHECTQDPNKRDENSTSTARLNGFEVGCKILPLLKIELFLPFKEAEFHFVACNFPGNRSLVISIGKGSGKTG